MFVSPEDRWVEVDKKCVFRHMGLRASPAGTEFAWGRMILLIYGLKWGSRLLISTFKMNKCITT